jgi:hypothetical protein
MVVPEEVVDGGFVAPVFLEREEAFFNAVQVLARLLEVEGFIFRGIHRQF